MNIKTIKQATDIRLTRPTVVVLGYFDGIHRGHQALFQRARQLADERKLDVALLTFPESPRLVFTRYTPSLGDHLLSKTERYHRLKQCGVDHLYLTDFTSQFARKTAQEFLDTYIASLHAEILVAGDDYTMGKDQKKLKELAGSFRGEIEIVPEVTENGKKIGSQRIRSAISQGHIRQANLLLGFPFQTTGIVVRGEKRGRELGYPTANLALLERIQLPNEGVYVVSVRCQQKLFSGMTSIGTNPTFNGKEKQIETHLFHFDDSIYGEQLTIFWHKRLRDIVRFQNSQQLISQLKEDEQQAKAYMTKENLSPCSHN